ncbi:hypothetical protein E1281_25935 [Actinomadura sp. KC345]|uniref:SAP domain-containing protein n=1 Tax=Actinomadura sp. KC345 TaxID=2530371 RepID=UPI001044A3FC|nr:SAP domain-containing protein [Actinomadura sp. KC345]TDC47644.1 hypothetical protein E1281_25935 [Actinomadura sp. KC345]
MPKITVHGGASDRRDLAAGPEDAPAAEPAARVQTLDDPYASWTRRELVAECRARDLPTSGAKDELVARLKANEPDGEE